VNWVILTIKRAMNKLCLFLEIKASMNKLCLFLEIFSHHGLSQDIHHLIMDDIMILARHDMSDKVFRRAPIKITRVIGGPTQQCQCWTSYCPYKTTDMTDYIMVRCSCVVGSKYIKIDYWETVYHHECYKEYLNHWIRIFL